MTNSGLRRGGVTRLTKLTWCPDENAREELYKEQINYIQQDIDGLNFMTDTTAQPNTSALSELPNVRVLFKIRRGCERAGKEVLREQQSDEVYESLQQACSRVIDPWVSNGSITNYTVKVTANSYEKQVGTVRVYIEVTFRGFIKRVITHLVIKPTT